MLGKKKCGGGHGEYFKVGMRKRGKCEIRRKVEEMVRVIEVKRAKNAKWSAIKAKMI